jgi:AcrR family transcriptional regulator
MRFEKGHKEITKKRIIEVASKCFKKNGVSATGLAGVMTKSGLTNGAFYAHFKSKEALIEEALSAALTEQHSKLTNKGKIDIEEAIRSYLKESHITNWDEGCPSAALLPEIGRQSQSIKKTYQNGMMAYAKSLALLLPNPESEETLQAATAIFSLMLGTLQIARAIADPALKDKVLEDGIQSALKLIPMK